MECAQPVSNFNIWAQPNTAIFAEKLAHRHVGRDWHFFMGERASLRVAREVAIWRSVVLSGIGRKHLKFTFFLDIRHFFTRIPPEDRNVSLQEFGRHKVREFFRSVLRGIVDRLFGTPGVLPYRRDRPYGKRKTDWEGQHSVLRPWNLLPSASHWIVAKVRVIVAWQVCSSIACLVTYLLTP